MNSVILEILFQIASPLFLATASRKKKTARKSSKRAVKKITKRPAAHKPKVRLDAKKKIAKKPLKKLTRAELKAKAAPPAPKKPVEEEPLPPPVAPIGRAILIVPKEGTYVESFHPTFRWLSVGNATRYEVHWSEDPVLTNKHGAVSLSTEATVPVEKPLRVGVIYYWRVRGGNDAGWGPWSPTGTFRVLEETSA